MNSQLNKVAFAICALVIVAIDVFQGQANPLGIPSYQFGVEVPLYRIKLPFTIGNVLLILLGIGDLDCVLEFLPLWQKLKFLYLSLTQDSFPIAK